MSDIELTPRKSDLRISLFTFPDGLTSVAPEAVTFIQVDEYPNPLLTYYVHREEHRYATATWDNAVKLADELRACVNIARTGEIPITYPKNSEEIKATKEALLKVIHT